MQIGNRKEKGEMNEPLENGRGWGREKDRRCNQKQRWQIRRSSFFLVSFFFPAIFQPASSNRPIISIQIHSPPHDLPPFTVSITACTCLRFSAGEATSRVVGARRRLSVSLSLNQSNGHGRSAGPVWALVLMPRLVLYGRELRIVR